jgi:hypothetical protein
MPVFQGEQGGRKRDPAWHRLWTALREIDRYLSSQSAWLVNDAERHRAGLRVGTSLTEATANFLVNRRMNKAQQMRWSRRGADLLLQVRYATTNSVLASASSSKPVPAPKRLWLPDPHSVDGPASGHHFSPPAIDFMGSIGFIGSMGRDGIIIQSLLIRSKFQNNLPIIWKYTPLSCKLPRSGILASRKA